MGSSSLYRKIGVVAGSAMAASLIAAGGSAQAATHLSTTTATKGGKMVGAPATATPGTQGGGVYFTPKRKPGQVGPMPTYACYVAFPVATVTQFHQTTWSGGTQCNINLRQQGTTV